MDILIPYVKSDAEELRFALRSIEKYHPDKRVLVIGCFPTWYTGDFIPFTRNSLTKQSNVRDKILKTIPHLSEDFILTYDDTYQLQPGGIPVTHCGKLTDATKKNLGEWFAANVRNTLSIYPDGFYYGNHYPIEINGKKFIEAMNVDWKKDYLVKSLYGNYAQIGGEYLPDCKFRQGNIREFIKDKQFFSTDQVSLNTLNLLNELFPTPSKYEKGDSN